jgi:Putative auto-transporter adhesin, head GIN domain
MKKQLSFLCLALMLSISGLFAQGRETRTVESFTRVSFRAPGKLLIRQGSTQKVELEGKKDILKEIETKVEGDKLTIGKAGKWSNWNWGDGDEITVYVTVTTLEGIQVGGSGDVIGETKFTTGDLDLAVSGSGSMKLDVQASGEIDVDVSGSGGLNLRGSCKTIDSDVSGSGAINFSLAIASNAGFSISGSGKIIGSGTANYVKTSVTGSGKILCSDLETNRCDVRISGSGDVEINVKTELDANISGSGTVLYKGNPGKVNSSASGSGKVSKF